jgi:phosphoenolpyruvate synthase/pyruvate phosphate dikinase
LIRTLHNIPDHDNEIVGGKAAGLAALIQAGFSVPRGFVITTDAYLGHVRGGLDERIRRIMAGATDPNGQRRAARDIGALFAATPISASLRAEVAAAYEGLDRGAQMLVAVRSSATAEDLRDASFAGAQETYVGVRGKNQVLGAVAACWASLFTPQAIAYRIRFGHEGNLAMAVIVQVLVDAVAAGVMCTIDPVTGDRSQIAIEAAPGLGVGVVGGEVTPDRFLLDKVTLEVRDRQIARKAIAYLVDDEGRVRRHRLGVRDQARPSLEDDEAIALARAGRRIERSLGSPQDVEWALGPGPDGPRSMIFLQSRPETIWSQRPRHAPTGSRDVTRRVAEIWGRRLPLAGRPVAHEHGASA